VTRRLSWLVALVALGIGWSAAQWRGGRLGDRWFDDDPAVVLPLADAVAEAVRAGTDPARFATGSERFDGEWALVTCQMGLIGLAQVAADHPDRRVAYEAAARGCLAYLVSPRARAFGTAAWGEDGLDPAVLRGDHGHAYLGWLALGLGAGLRLAEDAQARRTFTEITDALARRLDVLEVHALETYPGETYPPDLALVAAAVAVSGRHDEVVRRFAARYRRSAVDPATGLLYQALDPRSGAPADAPRGSGTAIAAAVWVHADRALAVDLATAARRELWGTVAGCGGVREVQRGAPGRMDIDSGPVLFGLSVSASGFGFGCARVLGDRDWHRSLFRSANAAGVPGCGSGWFATGGTMGNALLLAMLTGGEPWPG
jgi:hypothetical protein